MNTVKTELTIVELVQLDGGVHDNGDGKGCIPDPFPQPKFPMLI
jgi:hypothetical protein